MKKTSQPGPPDLLLPGEAAALLRVDAKTVTRWANNGTLPASAWIRLPTGHHRYWAAAIHAIRNGHGGGQS